MRKILLFIAIFGLVFSSCKKNNDGGEEPNPPTYEDRMTGTWDLKSVDYDSEFINPLNPTSTLQFMGAGSDVSGTFIFTQNPNEVNYSYNFKVDADSLSPTPIPVNDEGSGTWATTADDSKIIITTPEQELILKVAENNPNRQVFQTTAEQEVFPGFSVTADLDLVLEKR